MGAPGTTPIIGSLTGQAHVGLARSSRRTLLAAGLLGLASVAVRDKAYARSSPPEVNLLTAELRLEGDWKGAPVGAVRRVCEMIRRVCFSGFPLDGDGQPTVLVIRGISTGLPAIWLHSDRPQQATVLVDIGHAAWMQLAYQLGHELGHVLANSWAYGSVPRVPSQWLEESIVEAFSIANMIELGRAWRTSPPFAGDEAYGTGLEAYAQAVLAAYEKVSAPAARIDEWLMAQKDRRKDLFEGRRKWDEGLIVWLVAQIAQRRAWMGELNAMNRWPERVALPLDVYLGRWKGAAVRMGMAGDLAARLERILL